MSSFNILTAMSRQSFLGSSHYHNRVINRSYYEQKNGHTSAHGLARYSFWQDKEFGKINFGKLLKSLEDFDKLQLLTRYSF